ncbi:MAG: CDP-alcohol phosphatidyltransferase family protein [Planctomycetota bacterium]|jgi:CDP-diacylglycerol--serine O-phosphatidyltransferase|nr:CDP-alcohol phosphatidyltransferase family protein [Planctomycetota bacterium]
MPANKSLRSNLRRVNVLPSLLTLGNFACGFFSIVFCLNTLFFTTRAQMLDQRDAPPNVSLEAAGNPDQPGIPDPLPTALPPRAKHGFSATDSTARASYMLHWACAILFVGMLFDMLDGKIARHMGADSAFGKELDSLADIVTFGVAPPVIAITLWISVMPERASWWGQVMIFGVVYAACAALRLARYNVEEGSDKNLFSGLPSPAAAGCIVTAVLLVEGSYGFMNSVYEWISWASFGEIPVVQVKARLLGVYLLGVGLLMVTTVPFVHLANRYLTGRKPFSILVIVVLFLALLWHEPRLILFLAFNGYMAVGLIFGFRKAWRVRREKRARLEERG